MAKKRRRGISAGTVVMLVLTAAVVAACAFFLTRIIGNNAYERTAALTQQLLDEAVSRLPLQTAERGAEKGAETESPLPTQEARTGAAPTAAAPTATPVPPSTMFTLAAAGTIYAPKVVRQSALISGDHYDFSPMFAGLGSTLADADLSIVTLETMAAGKEAGYANYNTSPLLLDALRERGVDLVNLATERVLEKGYTGLEITVSELASRSLAYAGVNPEGGGVSPTLMQIGNVQVAVLAYAYGLSETGEKGTRGDRLGVLALMESARMTRDIQAARIAGANLVVVLPHWGTKNKAETPSIVRTMARNLGKAGADVILGTHPNVAQGIERITTTRSDGLAYETVVCYSLGSLLTDARTAENAASMAVTLPVTYDPAARRMSLGEVDVTPLYISVQRENGENVYRIVNCESETALAPLNESERAKAADAAERIRTVTQQEK